MPSRIATLDHGSFAVWIHYESSLKPGMTHVVVGHAVTSVLVYLSGKSTWYSSRQRAWKWKPDAESRVYNMFVCAVRTVNFCAIEFRLYPVRISEPLNDINIFRMGIGWNCEATFDHSRSVGHL